MQKVYVLLALPLFLLAGCSSGPTAIPAGGSVVLDQPGQYQLAGAVDGVEIKTPGIFLEGAGHTVNGDVKISSAAGSIISGLQVNGAIVASVENLILTPTAFSSVK